MSGQKRGSSLCIDEMYFRNEGGWVEEHIPEVLCAVLVREPLWLEARMDDQALFEGIVVFSDEDGPGRVVCIQPMH